MYISYNAKGENKMKIITNRQKSIVIVAARFNISGSEAIKNQFKQIKRCEKMRLMDLANLYEKAVAILDKRELSF